MPAPAVDRRTAIARRCTVIGAAGLLLMGLVPGGYLAERPGPAIDTLGQTDAGADVIGISGATTYPVDGHLDLTTVSVPASGRPSMNWFQLLTSAVDPTQRVLPIEAVYPPSVTAEESEAENAAMMTASQSSALTAALKHLGIPVTQRVQVESVDEALGANGVLKPGDVLLSAAGVPLAEMTTLAEVLRTQPTADPLTITLERDGQPLTLEVPVSEAPVQGGAPRRVLGITVRPLVTSDVKLTVGLERVGGPSAGQMFALAIIDRLTPDSLTGGKHIAGTGTIDDDGTIGPIGGLRQKLYGAKLHDAEYFLAPAANCAEVKGAVPEGLRVFSVGTLDDSLAALEAIRRGDTSNLPVCG